jgi:HEAT repeat protein
VRALAIDVVGRTGGADAVERLTALLADPAPAPRAAAARALGHLGHWPAAGRLRELLRDPAWDVRRAAGVALHALGAPGALLLRRALLDEDRFAADMARQILQVPAEVELEAIA